MPQINGRFDTIDYKDLVKEFPLTMAYRRDQATVQRFYSCSWSDVLEFAIALRGNCVIKDGRFSRITPHNFNFQNASYPFVCTDVSQAKAAGWMTYDLATNADPPYPELDPAPLDGSPYPFDQVPEDPNLAPYHRANVTADYIAVRYVLAEDDVVNDPTLEPTDGTGSGDPEFGDLPYNEWDRYTEWSMEWSNEVLTVPGGMYVYTNAAYKVGDNYEPVTNFINFPSLSAQVTAKVYGLPTIPPAAFSYPGTVNKHAITFYLDDKTSFFADSESLLFQPVVTEPRFNADLSVCYDLTYRWIYRPQGHNHYLRKNTTTKRYEYERIAVDPAHPLDDNSAPFSLRHIGYLWSPQTP